MKLCIGIPAYNEEKNIKNILTAICDLSPELFKILEKIIVVSDGSNDKTDSIVRSIRNSKIILVRHKQREGTASAINSILRGFNEDILILMDADIKVDIGSYIKRVIQVFSHRPNLGVATCIPRAAEPTSLIQRGLSFASKLRMHLIKLNPYYAFNVIIALKKAAVANLHIPKQVIGEDAYIYLSTIKRGYESIVCDIHVIYNEPATLQEAINQFLRYKANLEQLSQIFGLLFKEETRFPKLALIRAILIETLHNPFDVVIWLITRLIIRLGALVKGKSTYGVLWETASTTK